MKEFFILLSFIIVFASLVVSFIAVFKILTNEFKESKVKWIVLSMIAIIGPILYLIEGRKYIVKDNSHLATIPCPETHFSWKVYYVRLLKNLNRLIKLLFLVSLSFIIFGYIVRRFSVSFFWESKQIGFLLLGIMLVIFFRIDSKKRKDLKIKNLFSRIWFWIILVILFFQHLTLIIYPRTYAYSEVVDFIRTSESIKNELGKVNGFTILPAGSFHKVMDNTGTSGTATFVFLVKGENQFKEMQFVIEKKADLPDWEVTAFYVY